FGTPDDATGRRRRQTASVDLRRQGRLAPARGHASRWWKGGRLAQLLRSGGARVFSAEAVEEDVRRSGCGRAARPRHRRMGFTGREQRKAEGRGSFRSADPHFGGERKVRDGTPARASADAEDHSATLGKTARTQADFRRQVDQKNSGTLLRRTAEQD